MATKVIDRNEARVPFWGDTLSFITGLDPLGQQNVSIQMYSHLLPGLNNVTGRIRSYSFYCWLLNEYAKIIKTTDPFAQQRFVRRAEYIIALFSSYKQIQGVSGALYANNRMAENLQEFDLGKGTYNPDGTTDKTYWKYHFGIFGQYYVGSMRSIGLIEEPVNERGDFLGIYRRTSKKEGIEVTGEDMAEAFEENILLPEHKELFLSCIESGWVKLAEFDTLVQSFNLTKIKEGSRENELLIEMLFDVDEPATEINEPTTMRRDSIVHILNFRKEYSGNFDIRKFTQFAYDLKGKQNEKEDLALTGWYFYQLSEYWQYGCAAILHGILRYVDEVRNGRENLQDLLDDLKEKTLEYLLDNKIIESKESSIGDIISKKHQDERSLNDALNQKGIIESIALGFVMIWKLYQENKVYLEHLAMFTEERGIGGSNDLIHYYLHFDAYFELSVDHFIRDFMLKEVLMRHQHVAYRKMGSGNQSTQKFIIENYQLLLIEVTSPENTSPRLNNLVAFLRDLHLFDNSNQMTEKGNVVLNKVNP